jgi:hypothetical protein
MSYGMTKVAAIQLASGTNINANLLATEKMLEEAARLCNNFCRALRDDLAFGSSAAPFH